MYPISTLSEPLENPLGSKNRCRPKINGIPSIPDHSVFRVLGFVACSNWIINYRSEIRPDLEISLSTQSTQLSQSTNQPTERSEVPLAGLTYSGFNDGFGSIRTGFIIEAVTITKVTTSLEVKPSLKI